MIRHSRLEDRLLLTLVTRALDAPEVEQIAALAEAHASVARLVLHQNDAPGDGILRPGAPERLRVDRGEVFEAVGPVRFSLTAGAFSQVNPGAAEALYAVVQAAADPAGKHVADLYAGSGGIARTLLAAGAATCVAVESSAASVQAGRVEAPPALRFVEAPVEQAIGALPPVDLIVLNPPRKGASTAVRQALVDRAAGGPIALIYVSCDPKTLGRDLDWLRARAPLALHSVTPVDLFPQTRHVETVARFDLG